MAAMIILVSVPDLEPASVYYYYIIAAMISLPVIRRPFCALLDISGHVDQITMHHSFPPLCTCTNWILSSLLIMVLQVKFIDIQHISLHVWDR